MSEYIGLFIIAIIFGSITVWVVIDSKENIKKKKIDAALRMAEMDKGYEPGTYSEYRDQLSRRGKVKRLHQEMEEEKDRARQKELERERLKQGIGDLERRLDNIQTIMDGRKEEKKA